MYDDHQQLMRPESKKGTDMKLPDFNTQMNKRDKIDEDNPQFQATVGMSTGDFGTTMGGAFQGHSREQSMDNSGSVWHQLAENVDPKKRFNLEDAVLVEQKLYQILEALRNGEDGSE